MGKKRNWVAVVAMALVLCAAVSAQADLVLHWTFDPADISGSTATDSSTYGNDGTIHGGATPVAGVSGGALQFDGTSGYVDVAHNASLNLNDPFSVGAWLKTGHTGVWFTTLVAKYGYTSITPSWGLGWTNGNTLGFYVRDTSGDRAMPQAPSGFGLDGEWHHVMGVRGDGKVTFYGDGVALGQVSDANLNQPITNDRPVSVARHHAGSYTPVTVDDVQIHNEALKPCDVARLFGAGVGYQGVVLSDNPVAYWRMDEASGNTLSDTSGNGHTATATNATYGAAHPLYSDPANTAVDFGPSSAWAKTDAPILASEFAGGGDYTIELWFNADTRHQGDLLAFTQAPSGGHTILLELESNGKIRYLHRVPAGGSGGVDIYSSQLYDPAEWNHLVAVRQGGDMALYLNGVQDPVTASFGANVVDDMDLTFGRLSPTSGIRHFNGLMDEVALYDRALSADEIRMHYYAATPEPATLSLLAAGALGLLARRRRRA